MNPIKHAFNKVKKDMSLLRRRLTSVLMTFSSDYARTRFKIKQLEDAIKNLTEEVSELKQKNIVYHLSSGRADNSAKE